MPEVTVEVDVYCEWCGAGLCNNTTEKINPQNHKTEFHIEPCKKCLEEAKDIGYSEGYAQAKYESGAQQ